MHGWLRTVLLAGLAVSPLGLAAPAWAQADSVTVNDQPTTEQQLGRINDLRRAGRHDDAADLLQELIDASRFRLITLDDGLYADAELWARRELGRDPALLASYRERYTATAERARALAAEDSGMNALREAYRRFGMTRPGLDLGLTLTARLLERGDLSAASAMIAGLQRHPDTHEARARLLYLRGVCDALSGDAASADDARQRLASLDTDAADRLARLSETLAPPPGGSGGLVDAGERPEGLDLALWDAPIDEGPRANRSTFHGLRSLPAVSGERVLVNTTRQVLALDRASGQPLWAYPPDSASRGFQVSQPTWTDTRGVAVSGGGVFAVVGDCRGTQGRGGAESVRSNLLVCLDEADGSVVWSRRSDEIGPGEPAFQPDAGGGAVALQQTHFVGTPIASQGSVFAWVRRTSESGVQTTWLAAFEARTGRLNWYRHLALVQVRSTNDAKQVTPQLLLDGDTLYLCDQVAVAAAIDLHSGAYRWLRVLAEDTGPRVNPFTVVTEGVHTPPVLTPSGLAVLLSTSDRRLVLLDPKDGRTLRELHDDPQLRQAQYLLAAGPDAVFVSRTYALKWDGDTGEVRWVHTFDPGNAPRGRGAVTQQFVVLPTLSGITTLRLSDGVVLDEVQSPSGNLTALDAEVLVSSNGRVSSYMSWDGAYARLVERVRRVPIDPGPGLSLAVLALDRGDRDAAVLEGLGFALAAVDRLDGAAAAQERDRVFDALRRMSDARSPAGPALRDELYELMALTATTAEQTAAYHLDHGLHQATTGDPALAVAHFQAVMVDPVLSDTPYGRPGTSVTGPAGASAQREVLALVREHGRAIYSRYDALAQQELDAAVAAGEPDPQALSLIAKRYPLSLAASRALMVSAEAFERRGRPVGALSQYQQALSRAITDDQREQAAGALLSYYERTGRRADALPLLERLAREPAPLAPRRGDASATLEQWRSVFAAMEAAGGDAPALAADLARPIVVPGRLLLPPDSAGPGALAGGLFVHTGAGEVARLDARRGGAAVWSVPVEGEVLHVLADDQGQVLVWSVDTHQLYAVDSATGALLWDRPADLGGLVVLDIGPAPPRPLAGPEVPHVHVGPSVVCFVGPSGRVLGIDRFRGQVSWQAETGIERVSAVSADPWTLAVAGVVGPELDLADGKLVLLDLYTGDPVLAGIDLHVGFAPRVVGVDADRLTVVPEAAARVSVFDTVSGATRWQQELANNRVVGGLAHGGLVVLGDTTGLVYTVRGGETFEVVGRCKLADSMNDEAVRFRTMGAGLLAHGPAGAVALDADGRVRWRTETRFGEGALHHAVVGHERIALISAIDPATHPDRLLARGESVTYRIDLVARDGGAAERTYTLGPIQGPLDPRQACVTGGGLALGMGPQTLLLPAAEPGTDDTPGADPGR